VADYAIDEGAIPPISSRLQDGTQPQLLDILQISFDRAVPHGCQVENHHINGTAWQRQGRLQFADLAAMVENQPDLWGSGSSTWNGLNDKLSLEHAALQPDSLRLIRPSNFRLVVSTEGAAFGNPRKAMRALFDVGQTSYNLKVTDPVFTDQKNEYSEDVAYQLENVIICVSISEPWNSYHYKLVAAIFTP
jgi:hypothetical protein